MFDWNRCYSNEWCWPYLVEVFGVTLCRYYILKLLLERICLLYFRWDVSTGCIMNCKYKILVLVIACLIHLNWGLFVMHIRYIVYRWDLFRSSPVQDSSENCDLKLTIKQRLQKFELTELAWDLIVTGSTACLSGNNSKQPDRGLL